MDEILWCDHSNESSLPVLSHGAIFFVKILENDIRKFGREMLLATFGSERVKNTSSTRYKWFFKINNWFLKNHLLWPSQGSSGFPHPRIRQSARCRQVFSATNRGQTSRTIRSPSTWSLSRILFFNGIFVGEGWTANQRR